MKTYADIKAEIAKLELQAEKVRSAEKAGVIGRIKEAIRLYGLTAQDLGLSGRGRSARGKQAAGKSKLTVGVAKYRDPETGKTWTGRGKPPNWIVGVKDRTPFLIDGTVEGARPAKVKRAKSTGIRGKRSPASKRSAKASGSTKKVAPAREAAQAESTAAQ